MAVMFGGFVLAKFLLELSFLFSLIVRENKKIAVAITVITTTIFSKDNAVSLLISGRIIDPVKSRNTSIAIPAITDRSSSNINEYPIIIAKSRSAARMYISVAKIFATKLYAPDFVNIATIIKPATKSSDKTVFSN